jgi:hypothetical protein
MPLSDIVNVVITRQTQTVSEAGFGIPLILGTSNHFNDLIRFYTSMDEVALDFNSNDREYIAAQDIFSQTISPDIIAIGRRQVDDVTIEVETASPNADYILDINGDELITNSSSTNTYSVVTLNANLVPNNRIAVVVNGTGVGTVTSVIDFDSDFVALNEILSTINGVDYGPVTFTSDQATTIGLVKDSIELSPDVLTATVTGARQITVVFNGPVINTVNEVNSVITTLGASQPIAGIAQGGFVYAVSHADTMETIAAAILLEPGIANTIVSGTNDRVLTVEGPINTTATVNSFVVTGGASTATATITNPLQFVSVDSIAADIVSNVNSQVDYPVSATDNLDGTFTLTNNTPGIPYTLRVSTSIGNPNQARVRITQVSPNQVYTVTINGIEFSYRAPINIQTADQIVTALVDLINVADNDFPFIATNNDDGSFEVNSDDFNFVFSISVSQEVMSLEKGLIVTELVAANPVADDLTAINEANNTWYALISVERDVATVKAIAAWVEARIKLFGTASSDPDIINVQAGIDTTSIAAFLNQAGYVRTFVMYHQDADYDYPEAAWFGAVLPLEPGSETWKFKSLNTISYSNLTTTQSLNALNKKANTYEFVGGVGMTANGTVAEGEYIDTVRGIDWLSARIQEFVFSVLVNNPKVPYTNSGIAVIQAEVKRALELGINNNFLSDNPLPIVTVPLAQDVPPADKANRILRNVRFTATLANAIHAVVIRGTVSV